MKKSILFLLLNIASINFAYSQIIAGTASAGLIISNPSVNFSVTSVGANGVREFDLNCDDIADMSVELYKGPTAIDGANMAYLHVLNAVFKVCADTGNMIPRKVNYYNLGDTLICPTNSNWYNDANIQLGNYGCMDCPGPFSVNNLFLAYKNSVTSQVGWIKISFNLIDGGSGSAPITLSIPQILSPCVTTSVSTTPSNTGAGTATCGVFTYDYIINPPNCNNWCDGSISISNISGGTPTYTYVWSSGQTTSTITNVCSGTYMFSISDAAGNSCAANFNVPNPAPITFSLSTTNVSCYTGNDGIICCSGIMGSTGPYDYTWSPFGGNGACATGLTSGSYYLCVTSIMGCQTCSMAVVNEPPQLVLSPITTTNVSCFGGTDGSICGTAGGGTPPYFYMLAPGGNSGPCTNTVPAGNYTLCVTDANSCQACSSAVVSQPTQLVISSITTTNVSCYSGGDGSICGNASGGTSPYIYYWLPMGNVGACVTNLIAGNYTMCVTDAKNCVACSTAIVNEPTPIQVNELVTQASCVSCCDGNVQIQVSGGTPAYAINYSPATPSCPGTYSYNVTDAKGCTYYDSVLVSYPTLLAEQNFETMFDVFPNPSKGNFEIKNLSPEISISKIKITDVNGKIVFTKITQATNEQVLINSNVADGIYFLHITDAATNKEFIKKIVVQK